MGYLYYMQYMCGSLHPLLAVSAQWLWHGAALCSAKSPFAPPLAVINWPQGRTRVTVHRLSFRNPYEHSYQSIAGYLLVHHMISFLWNSYFSGPRRWSFGIEWYLDFIYIYIYIFKHNNLSKVGWYREYSWRLNGTTPLEDQGTSTMTWYLTQSYYSDTKQSNPCLIILMLIVWLEEVTSINL